MMKFINYIQYTCTLLALSSVFIVALMRLFECETDIYQACALIFPSLLASLWICDILWDISNYLKNNERNRNKKKTLRD